MRIKGYLSKRKRLALNVFDPLKLAKDFQEQLENTKFILEKIQIDRENEYNSFSFDSTTKYSEYEVTLTLKTRTKKMF